MAVKKALKSLGAAPSSSLAPGFRRNTDGRFLRTVPHDPEKGKCLLAGSQMKN
jgi:hypothetical protein